MAYGQHVVVGFGTGLTWTEAMAQGQVVPGSVAASLDAPGEAAAVAAALAADLAGPGAFWVADPLRPGDAFGPYLGLVQLAAAEPAGGWVWADASPVDPAGWHPSQPDNFRGDDRGVFFASGGAVGWGDTVDDQSAIGLPLPRAVVMELRADLYRLGGTRGPDLLLAGDRANALDGGPGADVMRGGGGDDLYYVREAGDVVVEAPDGGRDGLASYVSVRLGRFAHVEDVALRAGAVRAWGSDGANVMRGTEGANRLDGLGGRDRLLGEGGADRLVGGRGGDVLVGGAGRDLLYGDLPGGRARRDLGPDDFVFRSVADSPTGRADRIFGLGRRDDVDLRALDADPFAAGDQAFDYVGRRFRGGEGDLRWVERGRLDRIEADLDGDRVADLVIEVWGSRLSAATVEAALLL